MLIEKIKVLYWLCITQIFYRVICKKIGKKSIIRAPISLRMNGVSLGDNVRVGSLTRLETFRNYNGQLFSPNLSIGNNTTIEQCCHIAAVGKLAISSDCVISSFVFIEDHEHEMSSENHDVHILKRKLYNKDVKIGKSVFIGTGAKILPGSCIGDRCVIGANAVVKGEFPSDCIIAGVPAKIIRKNLKS